MKKVFHFLLVSSLFLVVACNSDKKDESTSKTETVSPDDKASANSDASKAEKNRQTALTSVKAFIAHDVDATLKEVAPDAVDYGDGSIPPIKSVDSVKVGMKAWIA